jgi:catechol 2,3-dioxygenase-like lactoylglutathione lyase family enzyme
MFAPLSKPRILESALYVDDLDRAGRFYTQIFDFPTLVRDRRMWAFDCGAACVLLLFQRGGALQSVDLPGGRIPPHDGAGPAHMAFAIGAEDLPGWEERLGATGIAIEARVRWPRGGESLYFRDPDNHLLELASPGLWANY